MNANKIEEEKAELAANSHACKDRRNKVLLWALAFKRECFPSLQIIHIKHNATALQISDLTFFFFFQNNISSKPITQSPTHCPWHYPTNPE